MKYQQALIKLSILLIVVIIAVMIVRTVLFSPESNNLTTSVNIELDRQEVVGHLADLIKFKTISNQDQNKFDGDSFVKMHEYLEQTFPLVFSSLEKEVVNQYSLLFKWSGTNTTLKPVLLLAHQDVVPVPETQMKSWSQLPFAGIVDKEFIWGRGTLDDKASLAGIFEAVNGLLKQNFQPERTIYLAFGHDEEVGGQQGAAKIAQLLKSRNVELEFVLDEGGLVSDGVIAGLDLPVALVGVAEKGYLSLELSVEAEGGHSSMPPENSAIGILSQAIVDLENNPFPVNSEHALKMFNSIGPYMSFEKRFLFANSWLTKPLIESILSQRETTNAMIRTTTAVTMIEAGIKDNVLPVKASAMVNFRLMPGETVNSVKRRVISIIDNKLVKVTGEGRLPSKISPHQSKSYKLIEATIHQTNGNQSSMIVTPYLMMGGTDARNFEELTENIYRFLFNYTKPEDVKRYHSIDERIAIDNYLKVIHFYHLLIKNINTQLKH